jgi:DnaK suppressor protein
MSRATAVKKKPVAKPAKATKAAARTAAPKARKPAKNNKPVAKIAKAAVRALKPASKLLPKPAAKPAAKPAPKPVLNSVLKPVAKPEPRPVSKPSAKPAAPKSEVRYAGMTESEIMRAPASQYMNSGQLAFFRERLLAMQRELLEKAGLTSEHLREHDIEPDPTDQATIEEEYALELRARDRERKLLKKIEQSLRRIDDGSYGYCEETGDAIGVPRLLARPTATLTIEAQARRELKQKLYGD